MRSFNYRVPRYSVDLPVQVVRGEESQFARCTEISRDGMRIESDEWLRLGTRAFVQVPHHPQDACLPIRIANAQCDSYGAVFIFESSDQRNLVNSLIASLTTPGPCTSLVLRHHP